MYEIQSKSDMANGIVLTVRIPEEDLDRKALYTIQADRPAFLVPFRHRSLDGQLEFTYIPGARSKMRYFFGSRNSQDYVSLWHSVLTPLLDCGDWFMNPFSLVLNTEHLYYDKAARTVSYLYIPSLKPCSDGNSLREMAAELSKHCPAADPVLENQALRAIMRDFSPQHFLHALKAHQTPGAWPPADAAPPLSAPPGPAPEPPDVSNREGAKPHTPSAPPKPPAGMSSGVVTPLSPKRLPQSAPGDIVISMPAGKQAKQPKKARPPKQEKQKGKGLFGSGDKKQAADPLESGQIPNTGVQILGGAALDALQGFGHPVSAPRPPASDFDDAATVLEEDSSKAGVKLRLMGDPSLPDVIRVDIAVGQSFTIGRFDASLGRKQSDFEFDKATKAVSRRHAAIERMSDGYMIVDLSSRAGTYMDGQQLVSNMAYKLAPDSRISFGNAGANYTWEI